MIMHTKEQKENMIDNLNEIRDIVEIIKRNTLTYDFFEETTIAIWESPIAFEQKQSNLIFVLENEKISKVYETEEKAEIVYETIKFFKENYFTMENFGDDIVSELLSEIETSGCELVRNTYEFAME